ncbi:MAG: glycosyl hydrolase family 43, partial [Cytophagaceae bacterium]
LNSQLYFAWSGWDTDLGGAQYIYITKLTNPYTATSGPRVRVSAPDYSWEKQGFGVNEGPEFLVNGNKVFLVYSASYCATDLYTLGQLSASTTSDLLNTASWAKSATPVFGPYASGGTYGPGHNGFFKSADGTENWIIYHANPAPGQGCGDFRSIRMQPFTYRADGTPDFGSPDPATSYIKRPAGK